MPVPYTIIEEATILRAQIEKGIIVVPVLLNFLTKIERINGNQGLRKSKKQIELDAIAEEMAIMDRRKKPVKK